MREPGLDAVGRVRIDDDAVAAVDLADRRQPVGVRAPPGHESEIPDAREVPVPARLNSPAASSSRHSAVTTAGSRPTRSNTKRSKFEALEMSIDGLEVATTSALRRPPYRPVRKNSSRTSFSLVATMRRRIGSPIIRATWPAQTLPKLPLGTANETSAPSPPVTAKYALK